MLFPPPLVPVLLTHRLTVMPCVIIRQRKPIRRKGGMFIYFEGNAGVIVNEKGEMKGAFQFLLLLLPPPLHACRGPEAQLAHTHARACTQPLSLFAPRRNPFAPDSERRWEAAFFGLFPPSRDHF